MQVSQSRSGPRHYSRTPVAAAILLALSSPALMAQEKGAIEEIIVTSQKRTENLQDVPISIQALGNQTLEELNLKNFKQYVQMLPTVAIQPDSSGSSFSRVYMRGIATAGDGQATTSQPSVGMYLDEQPITTIQGNLDIHMYDIARVEALAGPQGTLYGASSQAGTIRIITNPPDPSGFSASYALEGNIVDGDDTGYVAEGYVNIPLTDNSAIRLVGWSRHDAGWIDNVRGTRTFPGHEDAATCGTNCSLDDITLDNANVAKDNYNTIDTIGARAALRIELNEDWTLTPTAQTQRLESEGSWGDDLSNFVPGDYAVTHFQNEYTNDKWYQVGLTIEGKIGNFDLVYSANYLNRDVDGSFDYTDYSYWYDTIYTTGYYADLHFANTGPRAFPSQFYPTTAGSRIMPGAYFTNDDGYTKQSHELRISTDPDRRVRGLLGFFWQHQYHDFEQHWNITGLADIMLMDMGTNPQFQDTVYLNSMDRDDRDKAVFGEVSFDITDDVEFTVGARFFKPQVNVKGFFGFGLGFYPFWSSNGENRCNLFPGGQADYKDKPCLNVDKQIKESDNIFRANLSWRVSDASMVYGTWSQGYRPGGINRDPFAGEYKSDFLTNWEAGWKSQWLDNTLQFNGAVFLEQWDDFQVAFVGANAITQVNNGPSAEVLGTEMQMLWYASDQLRISAAAAFYDSELKDDYCPDCAGPGMPWAPAGTRLPVTARFKSNVVMRYMFEMGGFDSHVQGALVYEGSRGSDMNQADNAIRGDVPANTFLDLSAGIAKESWAVDFYIRNATNEDAPLYLTSQCATGTCGSQNYGVRAQPRTFGIKFSQEF